MDAIIYTTNTGSTGRYAKLLENETGIPAYSFAEAKKKVAVGAKIHLSRLDSGRRCLMD